MLWPLNGSAEMPGIGSANSFFLSFRTRFRARVDILSFRCATSEQGGRTWAREVLENLSPLKSRAREISFFLESLDVRLYSSTVDKLRKEGTRHTMSCFILVLLLLVVVAVCAKQEVPLFTLTHTFAPHPTVHPSVSGLLSIDIVSNSTLLNAWLLSVKGKDANGHVYTASLASPKKFSQGGSLKLPLLGLAAGQRHRLTIAVEARFLMSSSSSARARKSIEIRIQPERASEIPIITTLVADTKHMAPGWTWWSNFAAGNNSHWAGSLMTDERGTTRWIADCASIFKSWWPRILTPSYGCATTGTQSKLLSGNLLIMFTIENGMVEKTGLTGLVELAPNGTTLHCWVATRGMPKWQVDMIPASPAPVNGTRGRTVTVAQLDAYVINHDVQELPNGNWMVIAFQVKSVQCPRWGKYSGRNVTGNEVIEFTPYANTTTSREVTATGTIVKRFSLFDALDACQTYALNLEQQPPLEWLHLNSVDVHNCLGEHAELNELIVSSFYLGWIVAVRYRDDDDGVSGSLKWIMVRTFSVFSVM